MRRWRSRFAEQGIAGIGRIAKGQGHKSSLPPGTVEEVLRLTHKEKPDDGACGGVLNLLGTSGDLLV